MKSFAFIFITSALILSCRGLSEERVTGDYFLVKMDYEKKALTLRYMLPSGDYIGVVPATVLAVGFDDKYILVQQHTKGGVASADTTPDNYFIIPLGDSSSLYPEDNIIGPLSESGFKAKRKDLGVSDKILLSRKY